MRIEICDCCEREIKRQDVPNTCAACKPTENRWARMRDDLIARHTQELVETKKDWMRHNGAKIPQAASCEDESVPALSPTDSPSPHQEATSQEAPL